MQEVISTGFGERIKVTFTPSDPGTKFIKAHFRCLFCQIWVAREITTYFFFISEQQVSNRFQYDQFNGPFKRKELSESSQKSASLH